MKLLSEIGGLDRRLLHVFVAGPGEGEGIALALPETGWVLIDGCRAVRVGSSDSYPLQEIVREFRTGPDDGVEALMLTHPHEDHAKGVAESIEEFAPKRVVVTGVHDPRRTIADEAKGLEELRRKATSSQANRIGAVLKALRAINSWDEEHGDLIAACDGVEILGAPSPVEILARAPDPRFLQGWFDDDTIRKLMVESANWLSIVLEVVFGRTCIVLGGDLPVSEGEAFVVTGWHQVMRQHQHLAYHNALKVPHHGSREALHDELVARRGSSRSWWLTPFNSSSLPRCDDDDGLDVLLRAQSPLLLTAMSLSKKLQAAHADGRVLPSELDSATRSLRKGGVFRHGDTLWRTGSAIDALDAVWCTAFDDTGRAVDQWRGRAALEVVAPREPSGFRDSTRSVT